MADQPGSATTIGIVLVHGIGEQRRFDHLSAEVRQLVAALAALPDVRVSVETRAAQDAEAGAEGEFWRADGGAPVKIHVARETDRGRERFCLCVHEAWWADLDDKNTLWNRIKFWFWGLGLWGVKEFNRSGLPGSRQMTPPRFPPIPGGNLARELVVRARLWAFANVFFLSALTVNLLNAVLRGLRLGQIPGVEVFYQYVGDVKLYQDRALPGRGPLTDIGDPRRVAIRRRLVRVLVDAYRADYDRWYVVAHSLGTVVAWNGLMETAHSLPNYLPQETYAALKAAGDPVLRPQRGGTVLPVTRMRPARPVWIARDDEVLDREVLFGKLRGFVSYGSPLDKFAYLWRSIVPFNNDASVWQPDFEWVNVYDHTDPVSSRLAAFDGPSAPPGSPAPASYAYKASRLLLVSHGKYLCLRKRGDAPAQDQFVLRLVNWMLERASPFPAPKPADRSWYRRTGYGYALLLRAPMWILGTFVFAAAAGWLGVPALLDVLKWVAGLGLLEGSRFASLATSLHERFTAISFTDRLLGVFAVSAAVVTLMGLARRVLEQVMEPRPSRQAIGEAVSER